MLTLYDIVENYEHSPETTPVMLSIGGETVPCGSLTVIAGEDSLFFTVGPVSSGITIADVIAFVDQASPEDMHRPIAISNCPGRQLPASDAYADVYEEDWEIFVIQA